MGFTVTGAESVNLYRAVLIKNALKLYIKTGMKANRAYTPKNMLAVVKEFTGVSFPNTAKGRQAALDAITAYLEERR